MLANLTIRTKLIIVTAQGQVPGCPTRIRRHRAACLSSVQKLVSQKRVVASGKLVPRILADAGNAVVDGDLHEDTVPSAELVEILLGIKRGHAPGASRRDGLAVHLVGDITGGEHARDTC